MKTFKQYIETFTRHPHTGHVTWNVEEIGSNRPNVDGLPEIEDVAYGIDYTMQPGMRGQISQADFSQQMTPDDPDEYEVNDIVPISVNGQRLDGNHPMLQTVDAKHLNLILLKYFDDHLSEEAHDYIVDQDKG